MNENNLIERANDYLDKKEIGHVCPGKIGRLKGSLVEVIFLVPEALDPNAVVDPPDVRVWVDENSMEVELIPQM